MHEIPPETVRPFVFSDPAGKRWPRLRLVLLIAGVLFFLALVVFVQTLFVTPQMRVPFSLRQLKGQLRALQKENPAGQVTTASLLWQKFGAARQAAKKVSKSTPARPRKKSLDNEVHLAFYTNGDPYSYTSLQQHAAQITHLCPEWMTVINGMGELQVDGDSRLPKFAANKGIALMPLLTNLVGDTWQPEAVENLAHGPAERQERFIRNVLAVLRNARASGVVIDWQQIDPAYRDDLASFIDKFADVLHDDEKELWLCVQPGQELDYIDFDRLSDNVDRFVAMLFDETSDIDPPGPLASRPWFEGWLHVLLEDTDTKQWIIALGSYGYDWTIGGKKADLIAFAEVMSRANDAEVGTAEVKAPSYSPYFYFQDEDKEHAVWFLDAVTFLNELREVRDQKAGGFALYRLGCEDPAIWDALSVPRDLKIDNQTRQSLQWIKATDTITDVGDGEIVTVDESHTDGLRNLGIDAAGYLTAKYVKFAQFPTLYHQGAGGEHQVAITFDDGPDPRWTPKILDILKGANAKAGADIILRRVKQQRRDGSIILLHDAGGDRSQTVEALPRILEWLHTRGDTVVPLSTLLGTTRDAVMPPLAESGQPFARVVSSTGFRVYHVVEEFLWAFMIVATALVVIRTLIVVWLAYRFRRRPRAEFAEPVSVVIAAYNEGKVIANTLRALLTTDYKGDVEVIVVDDGSRDETVTEAQQIAAADSRVRLLQQQNSGKARALQRALSAVRRGIVVFIDADTQCQRDTLPRLLEPFADAGVGAVSGHAKVGNLRRFIARC